MLCSSVLAPSGFGRFSAGRQRNMQTVELSISVPLEQLQFSVTGERLYLLDSSGSLTILTLSDASLSTFSGAKLAHFEIQSSNCFSVCGVVGNGELVRVWLESRRSERLANLGLTRVLSFQKNHLTNLLLIVDFQLVLLLDAGNGKRVAALKASKGDTFSCGRFLDQNRFIIVGVKGCELRVVEILGMQVVERIQLPVEVKGMSLEASLDGSAVAVFGDSNVLLIVRISPIGKLSYQMAELPLKGVICARFTHQNDLLLLGSDRVLYGIPEGTHKLVTVFSPQVKLRISRFDVALHTKTIALCSARSVHLLTFPKGIRKELEHGKGETLEFGGQAVGEYSLKVEREINPQQQTKIQTIDLLSPHVHLPPLSSLEQQTELVAQVGELKASAAEQSAINSIYLYLHQCESVRKLVHLHKQRVVKFLQSMLALLRDSQRTAAAAQCLLSVLAASISDGSLDKFALILAPRVFQRIEKVQGEFSEFSSRALLSLFSDYLSENAQQQALRIMVRNCHREWFLPIFLLSLFLQMRANSPTWPLPHQQELNLQQVLEETDNIMSNPRHTYIFAKQPTKIDERTSENLQGLLIRQQKLRQSLEGLRKNAF